ncbi:MAG: diacylglycerol kinase family protein [Saprospiraceae bacterium]
MLRKRLESFKYAFQGIASMFASEPNAIIHALMTIVVIAAGFFFQVSPTEWCLLSLAIAAVFCAEAFNTALESLTNLVSPDHHPLAGKTKDVAAGAVLCMAIGAAVVGLIIFIPKIMTYLNN